MWFDALVELKKRSGKTLKQISEESGVPLGTLNKLFAGQTKDPKLETVRSVVHTLGYTLDDLDNGANTKTSPSTAEAAPGEELHQEIIRLAGKLSSEQKDLFLALLRLTAARNQGLSAAALVSAGEAALKSDLQNPRE